MNRRKVGQTVRTAGIIAEYNPFHRGHRYHMEETRRQTGADYIIAVMSGCYVQRGEPAVVDKYVRTRMALDGGADLVLELPVVYATASAEYFASAGVRLLDSLGCVDVLSFGSEYAGVDDFAPLVKILSEEPPIYQKKLREALKSGKNFPLAREEAMRGCMEAIYPAADASVWEILRTPNHILGLEYLKCLHRLRSGILPVAIKRQGAGYHDTEIGTEYPSASAIRRYLSEMDDRKGKADERQADKKTADREKTLFTAMGEGAELLCSCWNHGDTVGWKDLMPYLDYAVLMEEEQTEAFFGFDADMAARFQKMYRPSVSFTELLSSLHTKRLTDAAWRRALLHRVLHIKKEDFLHRAAEVPVPYARVLGFKERAAPLLKEIRRTSSIPLLQRPVQGKQFPDGSAAAKLFAADIRAAQLYEQVAAGHCGRVPVSEWVRQQVIVSL